MWISFGISRNINQKDKAAGGVGGLEEKVKGESMFAVASDFDRVKTDANSHIQWPAGG